ncbi:G2 and S phase-expressed protein 1 isoform X1 [Nannospalax galili]|uniref:G2 and S phase-expressed protein 1 isoform X1 n=1 Tax=Nannospalax galili TaxID=1026970 RepID=UPI00111BEB66|nr:G2 and S phase-expressed protein 1 isoform X1 [Nannospalax galili]
MDGGRSRTREAKMDAAKKGDILLLADEKFDFDLSLSSLSANEDDEVFFGPVGHKERCIAAGLELNHQIPEQPSAAASGSPCTWSPLTGEKFVEVYKEAHLLALQIESHSRREVAQATKPGNAGNQGTERFIQDSKLKISLFEKEQKVEKSPMLLKRETFCLSGSPLTVPQLSGDQPPSGEPLLLASSPALPSAPALAGPVPTGPVPTQNNPGQPCSSQPPNQAGPQKRIASKLQPPRALPVRGRHLPLATEKPKKEVPASLQRIKLNEKESHRDVLPDKPSTAPDAASLLTRGSHPGPGKRSLRIPNKKSLLKPPSCTTSLLRKSSSSGSALSLTSSACASPAAGKAKPSEPLASIPASGSRPLSSTSKLGKIGPTILRQALPAAPSRASYRQASRTDGAQPTAEQPKVPTTAPFTQPRTPDLGGPKLDPDSVSPSFQLNKIGSIRRQESDPNSKTKVVSTPVNPFKIPPFPPGESPNSVTPKFSRPQRQQSWTSSGRVVHSTPVRRSSGPTPQGLPTSMKTPMSARRRSTLPTPASRSLPGLPLMTPQTMPRPLVSPLCVPARRLSSEPRKRSAVRAGSTQASGSKAGGQAGWGLSSDESSSPPSSVPQALRFSPEKSDFPLSQGSTIAAAQDEAEPREDGCPSEALVDIRLDQLTITPEAGGRDLADRPLIDFSNTPEANVALGPSSQPLLDLVMNTPDTDRNGVGKPLKAKLGQLIDLGSPLIQLSPEAEKENMDSPLLKF